MAHQNYEDVIHELRIAASLTEHGAAYKMDRINLRKIEQINDPKTSMMRKMLNWLDDDYEFLRIEDFEQMFLKEAEVSTLLINMLAMGYTGKMLSGDIHLSYRSLTRAESSFTSYALRLLREWGADDARSIILKLIITWLRENTKKEICIEKFWQMFDRDVHINLISYILFAGRKCSIVNGGDLCAQ